MARTGGTDRTGVISVMAVTRAEAVTTVTIVTIVMAATTVTKGPLPTARTATERTATDPQVGASRTVRPALRMVSARRGMIATVREDGPRVLREMTDRAATTSRADQTGQIVRTGQIGQTVLTVRIAMAVRTGRTETAVATRIAAPGVTVTVARAVAPVVDETAARAVVPAGTKTVVVGAARTNALARAAASPNRPTLALTMPHLRQWCGF